MKKALLVFLSLAIAILIAFNFDTNPAIIPYRIVAAGIFWYCIKQGIHEKSIVNPFYLFSLTPLSLLLYSSNFAPQFLHNLTESTWFFALYNMIGFILALKIYYNHPVLNHVQPLNQVSRSSILRHIITLDLIGAIPTMLKIFNVSASLPSLLGLCVFLALALALRSKNKTYICLSIAFILLNFVADFNKTLFLEVSAICIVGYEAYYIKTDKDKRRLIVAISLILIFMLVVAFPLKSYIRSGGDYMDFANNAAEISDQQFSNLTDHIIFNGPDFLKMPYMYLVQAWNNVQFVLETQDTRTYGLWSIKPFLTYFGINTWFDHEYTIIAQSAFNTFSFSPYFFKDFGYFGSILGSFLLGMYVKFTYKRFVLTGSAFDVATYSLVAVATVEMFFSNHFLTQSYPISIFIIGYLYKSIFKLSKY